MSRLIDADALKEKLKLPEESGRMGELLGMVIDAIIEDAPTIEERKTGKWMRTYMDHEAMGVRPFLLYCSCCNSAATYERKFCPECGADMRGKG